jgi:hypothetical protein
VFYWYYYSQYPWATSHFNAILARAQAQYPDSARILASPEEPGYQEVVDAFNYATLTPVAANFQRFNADLRPEASL